MSGPLYLPFIVIPSKVLPISCLCTKPFISPCKTITSPVSTKVSVHVVLKPLSSENSKPSFFKTQVAPLESSADWPVLLKNILYWVLSGITTLSKSTD